MKLQISFSTMEQSRILELAPLVATYAEAIKISTFLLYKYGAKIVEGLAQADFKPMVTADAKIVDHGKELTQLMIDAGAHWVTVMAGTDQEVIHSVCNITHSYSRKTMMDLRDAASPGQSALEAKSLGVDAILFQSSYDPTNPMLFMDRWDMVRGNTDLPIYISAHINRDTISQIVQFKPNGIIVGDAIVNAKDPVAEAKFFSEICKNN